MQADVTAEKEKKRSQN